MESRAGSRTLPTRADGDRTLYVVVVYLGGEERANPASKIAHPSVEERRARGKAAAGAPLSAHAGWEPATDRPDPVALLEEQNTTREPDLVPVRHGRMMVSPFTFYRGAAKIMAADLKDTPRAGLDVQLCGDAHLSNFGVFASPERQLLFDLNDFDETLPGPFEYDVKRMAASFTIAARNNGFTTADARARHARVGRRHTGRRWPSSPQMRTMEIWYAHLSRRTDRCASTRKRAAEGQPTRRQRRRPRRRREGGREGPHPRQPAGALEARPSWSTAGTGSSASRRSSSPMRELAAQLRAAPPTRSSTRSTSSSAPTGRRCEDDRRHLLERFEFVDVARKVVGVGSVGTRAFIVLLQGRDEQDPLFLQVKEATASVLEDHLPKSRYQQPGERVVQGQRMMQAASDIFLGWTEGLRRRPPLLLAAAARHEGLGRRRGDGAAGAHALRAHLRLDAGAGPRPIGGSGRDRRVPRQEATASTGRSPTSRSGTPIRTSATTRRSSGDPIGEAAGHRRCLSSAKAGDPTQSCSYPASTRAIFLRWLPDSRPQSLNGRCSGAAEGGERGGAWRVGLGGCVVQGCDGSARDGFRPG